jgi:uncharacterized protein with von Willebrand factor type A (vWA) domain
MNANPDPEPRLAPNIMHFARLLRRAGLPVGPAETLAAQKALTLIDIGSRKQVQTALRSVMIHRHEHFDVFDQAFALFWRSPEAAHAIAAQALLGGAKEPENKKLKAGARRLAEALASARERTANAAREQEETVDFSLSASERERLHQMDFEAMSAEEIAEAKAEIRKLALPLDERRIRRTRPDPSGALVDLRGTMRASLRQGGEILEISRRRRRTRPPPLVILCDISGSMQRYAQILLHFIHAVANARTRVHAFLFGTRLTNITRQLRNRDPEVAFELISHIVPDWSGGTRIGESLARFNRIWARRVLGQGAVVLLMTDGLDREGARGLAEAMERLHRSSRRLVWLNPLLRWEGFEPKAQGARAMLPHVDEFRPVHNLKSLSALVDALARPAPPRDASPIWRKVA